MATITEKKINTRIIQKHDLEKNWMQAVNFIPKAGELIVYDIETSIEDITDKNGNVIKEDLCDYPRLKIGDGETYVNDLKFLDEVIWEQFSTMNQITATDDGDGNIVLGVSALASTEGEEY